MYFKTPLEIKVLYKSEASVQLEELELDVPITQLDIMLVTLYSINVIMPTTSDDDKACVDSGGETFYTPYSYEKLKEIVRLHCEKEN